MSEALEAVTLEIEFVVLSLPEQRLFDLLYRQAIVLLMHFGVLCRRLVVVLLRLRDHHVLDQALDSAVVMFVVLALAYVAQIVDDVGDEVQVGVKVPQRPLFPDALKGLLIGNFRVALGPFGVIVLVDCPDALATVLDRVQRPPQVCHERLHLVEMCVSVLLGVHARFLV